VTDVRQAFQQVPLGTVLFVPDAYTFVFMALVNEVQLTATQAAQTPATADLMDRNAPATALHERESSTGVPSVAALGCVCFPLTALVDWFLRPPLCWQLVEVILIGRSEGVYDGGFTPPFVFVCSVAITGATAAVWWGCRNS